MGDRGPPLSMITFLMCLGLSAYVQPERIIFKTAALTHAYQSLAFFRLQT